MKHLKTLLKENTWECKVTYNKHPSKYIAGFARKEGRSPEPQGEKETKSQRCQRVSEAQLPWDRAFTPGV